MGYNGRLSLKILEKSVKVQNLPYPLLRGQPLNELYMFNNTSTSLVRVENFVLYFTEAHVLNRCS